MELIPCMALSATGEGKREEAGFQLLQGELYRESALVIPPHHHCNHPPCPHPFHTAAAAAVGKRRREAGRTGCGRGPHRRTWAVGEKVCCTGRVISAAGGLQ